MAKMMFQKGQSTVEYVLLLALVMFLVSTVIRSPRFQEYFGENSAFFTMLKDRMEYSYRYTQLGNRAGSGREDINDPKNHDSYAKDGSSRFATSAEPYGGN